MHHIFVVGVKHADDLRPGMPLQDFGLDSLMSTEIHHVLAKRYNVKLTLGEVQNLTVEAIYEL